jgi:hypothetical protein
MIVVVVMAVVVVVVLSVSRSVYRKLLYFSLLSPYIIILTKIEKVNVLYALRENENSDDDGGGDDDGWSVMRAVECSIFGKINGETCSYFLLKTLGNRIHSM